MKQTESQLQEQIADYLRLRYPNVMFHSDYGSGIKLTMQQAIKQKRQNGGRKGWPDMFIAVGRSCESCGVDVGEFGLFLELKAEGVRLKKKDGSWANEHIAEQAQVLEELEKCGYVAKFAVGFSEAKEIIDDYLGEKE